MIKITCYDATNGRPNQLLILQRDQLQSVTEPWILGHWPRDQFVIQNTQAHQLPPDPSGASRKYRYDYVAQCWQLDAAHSERLARQLRNQRLSRIDRITPVWWESLTAEQQQEVREYQRALLDVPQQPGFPADVTWPEPPQWL